MNGPGLIGYLIAQQLGDEDAETQWQEEQRAAEMDADYYGAEEDE